MMAGVYLSSMTRTVLSALVAMPLALSAPIVRAETGAGEVRAVLVGVADYLHLDADLQGPPADVALMAETLMVRGVAAASITALTTGVALPDGVVSGGAPVRADILAALDAVAKASEDGDTVVFYFSGHGSQAPDANGDEGGGYDEILLPADADKWKGQVGSVENALVDDELAEWARPLLAKGVKIVGIIDACHSATGFRAVGGEGRARWVPPEALGLPEADEASAAPGVVEPMEGEFVFLYSSQSDQRSFEYPDAMGQWHGEFTLRLAEVLKTAPEASWAQVLAAVTDTMAQGSVRQQPEAEGPLLGAAVFGQGSAAPRAELRDGKVQAGFLDGIEEGAELAFFAAPAGGESLGTAVVKTADARVAEVSNLPAGAAWAEVIAPAPPRPLTLAAPVRLNAEDGFDYGSWEMALPAPGNRPDLTPILTEGVVALAGPDAVLDPDGPGSSPRIRPEPTETEAEAVARMLDQVAHGLRLKKLLLSGGGKARTLTSRPILEIGVEKRPSQVMGEACSDAGVGVEFDGIAAPCDQLWLDVKNTSGKDQDVTVLYLSADYTVSAIWPRRGLSNRLAHGEGLKAGMQVAPDSLPSVEEIWIIAVPVEEDGPRTDLTVLATPLSTREVKAGAKDPLVQWMDQQMTDENEGTRGFAPKPSPFNLIRKTVRISRSDG